MYKTISGILTYDDDGNYVVGNINFSSILDKIYYANNNHLDIKIYEGNKILYIENGNLYRVKQMILIFMIFMYVETILKMYYLIQLVNL